MARRIAATLLLGVALLPLVGCQRTIEDKTVTIEQGQRKATIVDAPTREQKVVAEVSSPGAPVDVYLVLEENRLSVEDRLKNFKGPNPAKVINSKQQIESGSVEGTIPAGKEYAVIVYAPKKRAEVHLKIIGR